MTTNNTIELAWHTFDTVRSTSKDTPTPSAETEKDNRCKQCHGSNSIVMATETVCQDCGLVQKYTRYMSDTYDPIEHSGTFVSNAKNTKLKKMLDWYMWTNDEKTEYKLTNYTKTLCARVGVPDCIETMVCNTVVKVMDAIKKHDGTKRAKVKDGIILVCVQYVTKHMSNATCYLSAVDLAKKQGIDIKYITRAEKLIMELVSSKKLELGNVLYTTQTPMCAIQQVMQQKNIKIAKGILLQVEQVISICADNDLLLDHTPLSIGVCCLFYVLCRNNIDMNAKQCSSLFGISLVTITKTMNKLIQYTDVLESKMV